MSRTKREFVRARRRPGLPRGQFSGPWLFSTAEARTSNSSSSSPAITTLHRAPVGQGPPGPDWLAIFLGFWSGRALATGTAWAGLCLIHHHLLPGLWAWRVGPREVAAACVAPRAARRRRRRRRQQPDDARPCAVTSDMIGWHESKDTWIVVYGSGALSYMEVVLCRISYMGGNLVAAPEPRGGARRSHPNQTTRRKQHGENNKARRSAMALPAAPRCRSLSERLLLISTTHS